MGCSVGSSEGLVLLSVLHLVLLKALRSVLQTAFPTVLLLVPHSVPQKILLLAPRLALHKGSSVGSSVGSRLALQAAALRPATTLTRCGRERWMPGSAGELLGVGRRLFSSRPRIRCPLPSQVTTALALVARTSCGRNGEGVHHGCVCDVAGRLTGATRKQSPTRPQTTETTSTSA